MALARIISNSQECSRELALNLLERGYAVEIVSPDAIPDNFADLELRIESDPSETLKASVKANNGERSKTLEFVHHVKGPLGESHRRLATASARVPSFSESANGKREHRAGVEPEAAREASAGARPTVSAGARPAARPSVAARPAVAAAPRVAETHAHPLRMPLQNVWRVEEAPRAKAAMAAPKTVAMPPSVARPAQTKPQFLNQHLLTTAAHQANSKAKLATRPLRRSEGWFWRSAGVFGGIVAVAVVLGFGLRDRGAAGQPLSGKDAASRGGVAEIAAGSDVPVFANPSSLAEASVFNFSVADGSRRESEKRNSASRGKVLAMPSASTSKSPRDDRRGHSSHGVANDVVAPDTITYFDRPNAKPIPIKVAIRERRRPNQ